MSLKNIKKMLLEDVMIPGAKEECEKAYKEFNPNFKNIKIISEKYLIRELDRVYQKADYYDRLLSEVNPNKINTQNFLLTLN